MIRRHWLLTLFASSILLATTLCFYIWQYTIELPPKVGEILKRTIFNKTGIVVSYDSLKISSKACRAMISGISLKNASESVLAKLDKINISLNSTNSILEIGKREDPIDLLALEGGFLDARDLSRFLKTPSQFHIAAIPIKHLVIGDVKLITPLGDFCLNKANLDLRRLHGDVTGSLYFSQMPWGGDASITLTIPFDLATTSIAIDWRGLQTADVSNIFPLLKALGIKVNSGNAEASLRWRGNLRDRLNSTNFNLDDFFAKEIKGNLSVKELVIAWKDHSIALTTHIASDKPFAKWKTSIDLDIEGSKISADCAFERGNRGWGIGARGIGNLKAGIYSLFSDLYPLPNAIEPGTASMAFQIRKIANGLWSGAVEADLSSWTIASMPLPMGKLKVLTEGDKLVFNCGCLSPIGELTAQGYFRPSERILESDVAFHNCQISKIPMVPAGCFGIASGGGRLVVPTSDLAATTFNGNIEILHPIFSKLHAERLCTVIETAGNNWRVINPHLTILPEGEIDLNGSISSKSIEGEAVGTNVPAELLGFEPTAVEGKCSFRLDVSGSIDNPRFTGELLAERIKLWGRSVDVLRAKVCGDKKLLSLEHLTANLCGDGEISGYLNFDIISKKFVATRIDAVHVEAALFKDLLPHTVPAIDPSGCFNASFESLNHGEEDGWKFSASAPKMYIASAPVGHTSIDGTWVNGTLKNLSGMLETGDGTIAVNLVRLSDGRYTSDIAVHDVDIKIPAEIFHLKSPLNGKLTIDGNLILKDLKPIGRLTVLIHDLSVDNELLGNAGGEIVLDTDSITIDKATFDRLGIQVSGDMQLLDDKPYTCNVVMNKTDLSALPIAYGFRSFHRNDVIITGSFGIKGRTTFGTPDEIEASIQKLEIKHDDDVVVSNKPIHCGYKNGIFEIKSFELAYKDGIFAAAGKVNNEGVAAVTLDGRDFSLRALGNLLDIPNWSANGSLSFSGKLNGQISSPFLDAQLDIKDFDYIGRKVPFITGKVRLTREKTELERIDIKLRYNTLSISGSLPGLLSEKKAPFDLSLEIASGPITDLPMLLPEAVSEASGTINASLHASGKLRAPIITGKMDFSADVLRMRGMKIPFKNVQIGLSTHDGVVRLEPLKALMGRGSLDGFGEADFRSGNASITAHISGQKVDLNWNAIEISGASAAIDIGGTLYCPLVRGNIVIPKGRAIVGDIKNVSLKRPVLPFDALDYKVNVKIPRNFWVKSSFLNAELHADFNVLGDKDDFWLDGTIQSIQGWLFFQRRKFLLENCEIKFGGEERNFNPQLFVKSVTNVQNTQIYLTLDGTISSLTPRLYSSPPLAESDLFSLLTLGRNMEEAQRTDAKELFENEILEGLKSTYLSGLIGSTISRALDLDELFFGSLFDKETGITRSFLRIGKYLGQNLFLAYEGTLSNEGDKTYICEYRLPKGFYLNIEVEKPRNRTRVGVKYDWNF